MQSWSNPTAPANNSAPAHSYAHSGGFLNNGENHQAQRTYTAPAATVTAPVNNTVTAPFNQHSSAHNDWREPSRPMNPQPAFTAPMMVDHPQHSEPRQNFSQTMPSPQNQNGSANGGGRYQNWFVQNR